jgi:sporulation protein YlmC with PRC-barrel domain
MRNSFVLAGTIAATVMAASAFAEPTGNSTPIATTPAKASGPDVQFIQSQSRDEWRAPKLVGIEVYDSADKSVGKIKDVLIGHDGNAEAVVIGVGGVLGFATKDVAVPFGALTWRTEGRRVAANTAPPPSAANPSTMGSQVTFKYTDPKATEANQGYPDTAKIDVSLDQLKSAPDFQYAPDPQVESENTAADSNRPVEGANR